MKDKNEYELKAERLRKKIPNIDTVKLEVDGIFAGRNRKGKIRVCRINSIKYILLSDICLSTNIRGQLINKGLLRDCDFYFFNGIVYNNRYQIVTFVRLFDVISVKDYLKKVAHSNYYIDIVDKAIEAVKAADIPNINIAQDDLLRSQELYKEYREAKRLSAIYNKEQKHIADLEQEKRDEAVRIDREKNNEKALRDLVQQIEDMGWHVTLSMKNG